MKASRLVVSVISSAALLGAAGSISAQSTPDDRVRDNGAPCGTVNAVADSEVQYPEHDTVYESANGITNDSPVNKRARMGWKKDAANDTNAATFTDTGVQNPEHDTAYDPLNGITNDSPVNKASRMGWRKAVANDASKSSDAGNLRHAILERGQTVNCN